MIAQIIPETRAHKLETFSYLIPKKLLDRIIIGSVVVVPFGKKTIRGLVTEIISGKDLKVDNTKLKEIKDIYQQLIIPPIYIKIIKWLANNYFCTLGEAFAIFLPPNLSRPRKEIKHITYSISGKIKLSEEQQKIIDRLSVDFARNNPKPSLLYGVTGSGKTEIYIELAKRIFKKNKSVIVLVPEIILTPQIVDRFRAVFNDKVAIIHSNLSKSEKIIAYFDYMTGKKRILIGPRSALLVPNINTGLIIIDEEHEDAYKQGQSPRYNAIDLAIKIGIELKIPVILGSATPRVESYYHAQAGDYNLFEIKNRYNKLMLPPSEIVDLKNELRSGNHSLISEKLFRAITKTLENKKQVILFLNRRGSSTFISCRECGYVVICPNCSIPLVHHLNSRESYLYCHHCNFQNSVPKLCPNCNGVKIKYFGAGVEKVEVEINKQFPKARIRRIDTETINRKDDYDKFYYDFKNHKFDIAIGTQMIGKGLDIPDIDLVGIVSADTGLHLPYFRSSEKVFRLITQVSGRSGRKHNVGRTIIQTYWPESKSILSASKHDFKSFFESEIEVRKTHDYPPFCNLIRIISENTDYIKAKNGLEVLAMELDKMGIDYIGPGQCFLQRLHNKWRFHLLIKLKDQDSVDVKDKLRELWRNNPYLIWDKDPYDLL